MRWALLAIIVAVSVGLFWIGLTIIANGGTLGIGLVIAAVLLFVVGFASSFPQATSLARDD